MAIIQDGGGSGRQATVSTFRRLNVSAKTNPRLFYASRDEAQTYNCISELSGATSGSYVFYLKNDSQDSNLFVQHIEFHSENAARWNIWHVNGTPAGYEISPSNLNLGSGNLSDTTSYGGDESDKSQAVTGLSNIKRIGIHRNGALGEGEMEYSDSLILTPGTAIAVEYIGATGEVETDTFYHFEKIGAK
jgi:hypothetical protein